MLQFQYSSMRLEKKSIGSKKFKCVFAGCRARNSQSKDHEFASTQVWSCQGPFLKLKWMSPQWYSVLFPLSSSPAGLHWYLKTAIFEDLVVPTWNSACIHCFMLQNPSLMVWNTALRPAQKVWYPLYRSTRWGSKEIHSSTPCGVDRASPLHRDTVPNYTCMNNAVGCFFGVNNFFIPVWIYDRWYTWSQTIVKMFYSVYDLLCSLHNSAVLKNKKINKHWKT